MGTESKALSNMRRETRNKYLALLPLVVKVFDVFLVLICPYMYVLGSFNTGVWNYYLLDSGYCVSRHPEEGKCGDTCLNVLAHMK